METQRELRRLGAVAIGLAVGKRYLEGHRGRCSDPLELLRNY